MADHRGHPSEAPSEERTEPFSQSEVDARLKSMGVHEAVDEVMYDAVPLDKLMVEDHHHKQGIRILVRPLTRSRSVSPGNGSCQWLALRAEVASDERPHHKVLAVTQTPRDIKFSVRIPSEHLDDHVPRPPVWCELYYDPASDNQILLNRSEAPITLSRLSDDPGNSPGPNHEIKPLMTKALSPGSWRISVEGIRVLDFRVLERMPFHLVQPRKAIENGDSSESDIVLNSLGKRSLDAEESQGRGEKKVKTSEAGARAGAGAGAGAAKKEDGVIMFLRSSADPLVFPLPTTGKGNTAGKGKGNELVASTGQALLDLQKDETVAVQSGCELDAYTVTKRDQIASTSLSSVFTAEHSNVPNGVITVKILKTHSVNNAAAAAAAAQKPQEAERNVIRQADMWLREYQSQDDLRHSSIVRLYGGDARFLSLYMEHVEARDLSARNFWRGARDDMFMGSRADASRILHDVASALHYLHDRGLVHNDIKPANILYSPDRGAVLCDFGLSSPAHAPATTGGTPFYVPPEFIGGRLRGAASDVWALGVTMLYVMRKLPFPDARAGRAHPRPLYWMIADLNRPGGGARQKPGAARGAGMSAVDQMMVWLSEVREAADRLSPRDRMERIIRDMLILNPKQRITTAQILHHLVDEQMAIRS
ncbi:kinase-like protein [Sodiomyces alkalinus F11]|uniref:Kinase-like protein n=1 Tax=Sodiomyces alkalinus (strain CBS 110278 / VKM F-3762 / F11) TaxID=1314773 RepID=A0A3N2PYJ8_SODAK|nr:kinase-like protein [Sodiomyces alkalinus F11]ROT39590.1 kinase-like protein [Sodiomyces alkalinus F11]